jgi:hypothetical protein
MKLAPGWLAAMSCEDLDLVYQDFQSGRLGVYPDPAMEPTARPYADGRHAGRQWILPVRTLR